jgi:hypothetical protein
MAITSISCPSLSSPFLSHLLYYPFNAFVLDVGLVPRPITCPIHSLTHPIHIYSYTDLSPFHSYPVVTYKHSMYVQYFNQSTIYPRYLLSELESLVPGSSRLLVTSITFEPNNTRFVSCFTATLTHARPTRYPSAIHALPSTITSNVPLYLALRHLGL